MSGGKKRVEKLNNAQRIADFFAAWTPDSAYVIGYFAADGCMYKSRIGSYTALGHYIEFTSVDEELIVLVRKLIRAENKIETATQWRGDSYHRRIRYKLRLVNKRAFHSLEMLGFTPNKSLELQFPNIPEALLRHFVRGYLDGDGCVYAKDYKPPGGLTRKQLLMVQFTSGSPEFLKTLRNLLSLKAGMGPGSFIKRKPTHYALQYSKHDSNRLFSYMYPTSNIPCLTRKRLVFESSLVMQKRPDRIVSSR